MLKESVIDAEEAQVRQDQILAWADAIFRKMCTDLKDLLSGTPAGDVRKTVDSYVDDLRESITQQTA